ncbi:hypothetical protein KY319_02825 [Candidatus Woesearchaeota archaeon]|nr:hypothetical protein [Candidatus Woesearchaeota archaeon]
MKKAQIIGQIFVFILAGLIFILIVSYGYKAIQYFLERQEQVVLVDFKTDLEIAVEGVKRDYGTVRKAELKLPSKYQGVCFFDYESDVCDPGTPSINPQLITPQQTINVKWAEEACKLKSANIFIIPRTQDFELPDIQIDKGYVCIPNTGTITIRLEGTGKKAKISAWT